MTRQTNRGRGARRAVVLLPALGLITLLAACGGAATLDTIGAPVPAASAGAAYAGGDAQPDPASEAGGGSTDRSKQLNDVTRPDLLIIKTGTMSLQVKAIDGALASASVKVTALGGYVSGSDRKGDGVEQVATVTYRIPAAQWDAALVALRALGDKVLAEQSQTQDVTGDVVDLGARIANLRATEAALQAIMVKATKISDVLAVQQQLTDTRGQIEQLTAEKQHLEGQAALSTLTVSYSLKPQAAVLTTQKQFDPNSEVDRASATLIDVLQGLATAGIWFAIVWLPILLVLAAIAVIVVVVIRRVRRGRGDSGPLFPTPTAPAAEA